MKNPGNAGAARMSLAAVAVVLGLAGPVLADDKAAANNWEMIRQSLFAGRGIDENAGKVLELDTPTRAEDAAVVPIAIRTKLPQDSSNYVKKVLPGHRPQPVAGRRDFHLYAG